MKNFFLLFATLILTSLASSLLMGIIITAALFLSIKTLKGAKN